MTKVSLGIIAALLAVLAGLGWYAKTATENAAQWRLESARLSSVAKGWADSHAEQKARADTLDGLLVERDQSRETIIAANRRLRDEIRVLSDEENDDGCLAVAMPDAVVSLLRGDTAGATATGD